MVPRTPESRLPQLVPVLLVSVLPEAPNDGCVIGELLRVTQLRVVTQVYRMKRRGGRHRALWGSSATEHGVRRDVF